MGQEFEQDTALLWSMMSGASGGKTQAKHGSQPRIWNHLEVPLSSHLAPETTDGLGLPLTESTHSLSTWLACPHSMVVPTLSWSSGSKHECDDEQGISIHNPPSEITCHHFHYTLSGKAVTSTQSQGEGTASTGGASKNLQACFFFLLAQLPLWVYLSNLKITLSFSRSGPCLTLPSLLLNSKHEAGTRCLSEINILIQPLPGTAAPGRTLVKGDS